MPTRSSSHTGERAPPPDGRFYSVLADSLTIVQARPDRRDLPPRRAQEAALRGRRRADGARADVHHLFLPVAAVVPMND